MGGGASQIWRLLRLVLHWPRTIFSPKECSERRILQPEKRLVRPIEVERIEVKEEKQHDWKNTMHATRAIMKLKPDTITNEVIDKRCVARRIAVKDTSWVRGCPLEKKSYARKF